MGYVTRIGVHGAAFQAQNPADFVPTATGSGITLIERSGEGGSVFNSPGIRTHRFFVVVPSPTILNSYLMKLDRVSIFYSTDNATIKKVSIFDGTNLFAQFDLGWSGSHPTFDGPNTTLNMPEPRYASVGISIFVEVEFMVRDDVLPAEVWGSVSFFGAIAHFNSGDWWLTAILKTISPLP